MNAAAKVIIVDDHPLIAQATKELMKRLEGVEVAGVAANGAQCLELIEEVEPDIVLLDFHLPDRSGDELAAVIKNSHPDVQIIIFTGIDVTDLYNHFIQIGVSGILSKESDGEVIKLMVKAVLHGQTLLPQTQLRQVRFLQGAPRPRS
ncbi:response regulator transcription factor [Paenibacillus sp. P25]|nr:response regulator transcription factor [Paenibacillus sp. P25]